MLTLEDQIIPYSILKLCINAYIQNNDIDARKDPFLSPLFNTDEAAN